MDVTTKTEGARGDRAGADDSITDSSPPPADPVDDAPGAADPVDRGPAAADPVDGAPAAADPVEEIWSLLRTFFGQHRRRFLIAASDLDLHPAQAGALMQLSSPLPMSELAGQLGCDSSNVTGLVDRLEARGLVSRQPSFADRRVKNVVLTEDGEALRERMLAELGEAREGFERLGADEQRQLRDLLRRALGDLAVGD